MRHSRSGNVAIEFAFSFVVLWAMLSGIFEFGYSMYVYNTLAAAVADGALYAARIKFEEPGEAYALAVQRMVVYGSPAGGDRPVLHGLTVANVSVTCARDAAGIPQTTTVAVTGYAIHALFRTYTLAARPRVTVRYAGVYQT